MPDFAKILAAALLALHPLAAPADAFWSRTRITRTETSENLTRVAVDGCTVHVAWIDTEGHNLHYARSDDAGGIWSEPRIVALNRGLPVLDLEIAANDGVVHLLWQEGAYDEARIRYRRSTQGGLSFRPARLLSSPGKTAQQPTLAVSGADVYASWIRTRRGSDTKPAKLVFTQSPNRGRTWLPPRRLGRRSVGLAAPLLASGDGQLHLFWGRRVQADDAWDLSILLRSSSNGGRSWLPTVTAVRKEGWWPSSVAVDGDTLHLAWQETQYKRSHVRWERSLDRGLTWHARGVPLEDDASSAQFATADGRLEAVWINDWDGTGSLAHGWSTDGGTTFSRRNRWLERNAQAPSLTVADPREPCGGMTHLVYSRMWTKNGHRFQEVYHRREPRTLP